MWSFFGLAGRMKYINRWGLMRNTRQENLSEHSAEVAMIAHALAMIGKNRFNKNYNSGAIVTVALYHDMPEILTGDLPTPVKYFSEESIRAYKEVENKACERILSGLPEDLRTEYQTIFSEKCLTNEEKRLVKAADKISALIKCMEEEKVGNPEFIDARISTEKSILEMNIPEAEIFLSEFVEAYTKTLDELLSGQ